MNQKILIANIILLLVILGLGYLVATTRYEPPKHQKFSSELTGGLSEESKNQSGDSETEYEAKAPTQVAAVSDQYANLGEAPIFDTIIPKPTPRPTRTPKPRPTPDLERVTARWKLMSLFGNQATFHDTARKDEWTMKVGEVREVKYRNDTCDIKLEKVDESSFKVIISYGGQEKTFSMW